MITFSGILDAEADGTVHVPLPPDLRVGKVRIEATVEPVLDDTTRTTPGMIRTRLEAFARVRDLNPFRDIADPVAWQREMRKDAALPGRE